ncbi:putative Zinc finger, RING/FYVE/PHD-type [Rosa chinensis]|uniref:Putative Zinc finger, RING/FYVE/PHD-type n=1 Tax=Rosa chinensis TaxID=74649 RepID=A0A2P6Q015_ROSCH|nr:putative Zinc finger, RING/FYVE/PHD-type [Rosa chinensis]
MGKQDKVVTCGTCRNPIHEECFLKWKRSARKKPTYCVMCRARWGSIQQEQEKYLNLVVLARRRRKMMRTKTSMNDDLHCDG